MRVVVVSAWEPWRRPDAAALVLREQLRRLAGRHELTLLAAGAPAEMGTVPAAAQEELAGIDVHWFGTDRSAAADHLRRRLRSLRGGEPAHVGYVERRALLAALDRRLGRGDVDLVHLHGWGTAGLWREVSDVPVVHAAIDPWAANAGNRRLSLPRRVTERGERRRIAAHERRHYPRLDAVVVVAAGDLRELGRLAPGARFEVLPNGVDAGPAPVPPPARPVVGFHGAYESRANVEAARHLVERILPQVRRRLPDARAVLIGRGPPRSVRALAGDAVSVLPDVPDVRAELDRLTVHVDWMTSGAGMKNKVLEAMAAGRPVVASALGAAGIGAGPGVTVAPDVDAAADAVVGLLTDPAAVAAAGEAARRRVVAEFGWDRNAQRLEQLWADVVAGRSA